MIDVMAGADPIRALNAQRLSQARKRYGYTLRELAIEVENVRKLRGDADLPTQESLPQKIAQIERTGMLGPVWREDLAAVFGVEPDEMFSVPIATELPHPLLLQLPVDHDVLAVIAAQQQAHIQAEHTFGPQHARTLVESDLLTIESLIVHAPSQVKAEIRRAAGAIAEVAGWIAQDLGDHAAAEKLTHTAALHLHTAGPAFNAMILMRQSNILTRTNPDLAAALAADAAELIDGHDVGRLAASIARQQALAELANHNERGFHRHAAAPLELGDLQPHPQDHAIYAHGAYVASEIASGYLRIGEPDKAVALLAGHHHAWTSQQHHDETVADMRLLHAYLATSEYQQALALTATAIPGYLSAPSQRARFHLARAGTIVRDRRRRSKDPILQQLAGRIKNATQGVTQRAAESSPTPPPPTKRPPGPSRSCRSAPSNNTAPTCRWAPTPSSPALLQHQSVSTTACFSYHRSRSAAPTNTPPTPAPSASAPPRWPRSSLTSSNRWHARTSPG